MDGNGFLRKGMGSMSGEIGLDWISFLLEDLGLHLALEGTRGGGRGRVE